MVHSKMSDPTSAGEEVVKPNAFVLRITVEKQADRWVAHCLELDLVTSADKRWKAVESLATVIHAQIAFGLEKDWNEHIWHPAPQRYFDRFEEIAASLRPASPPPSAPTGKIEVSSGESHAAITDGLRESPNDQSRPYGSHRTVSNQSDPLESNSVAPPSARPAERRKGERRVSPPQVLIGTASVANPHFRHSGEDRRKPAAPSSTGGEEKMSDEFPDFSRKTEYVDEPPATKSVKPSASAPKLCDMRDGDVQCPAYFDQGDSALRCQFTVGHPGLHRASTGKQFSASAPDADQPQRAICEEVDGQLRYTVEGATAANAEVIDPSVPINWNSPQNAAPSASASAARTFKKRWSDVIVWQSFWEELDNHVQEQTRQLREENAELQKQVDAADRWSLDTEQLRNRIKEEKQRAQAAEAERDRAKAELAAIMKTLYIDVYDEDEGEPYSYLLPAEPEPIVCESISEAVKEFYELCDKEHNKLTEELERLRKEAK